MKRTARHIPILVVAVTAGLSALAFAGCWNPFGPSQVAAPTFSPRGGTYSTVKSVVISTTTQGAWIRYTVEGSTPSRTSGTLYDGPVSVSTSTTLKAIAYLEDLTDSKVSEAAYVITLQVVTPKFSIAGGTYMLGKSVSISCATQGATIYYTTDGSTPSTSSTVCQDPISVAGNGITETIKAIAAATGMKNSNVASATYRIGYPVGVQASVEMTDQDVSTLSITAYRGNALIGGPTLLPRSGDTFQGTVSVNAAGTLVFDAAASNAAQLTVYQGSTTAKVDAALGGSVTIAMAPITSGALDECFGPAGKVVNNIMGAAIAALPDGKVLLAGYVHTGLDTTDLALARYAKDGSLDTSFGGTGEIVTAVGTASSTCSAAALQSDGKLVVAVQSVGNGPYGNFALARYNTDGSLDTSFGGTGTVITDFGNYSGAMGVAIQPDGKIVAVGGVDSSMPDQDFALARYNADGSLDTSFAGTGKVVTVFGADAMGTAIALQSDGKIVVAGFLANNHGEGSLVLVRYDADGSLNTSFNGTGEVANPADHSDARGAAIQSDGRIVVLMSSGLARYYADGSIDTSFGTQGTVTWAGNFSGTAMTLQSDGRVVAAGVDRVH